MNNRDVCRHIVDVNNDFYNLSGVIFDKIPFDFILPDLLLEHLIGQEILEVGSGSGALACWLAEQGYEVRCVEPAVELVSHAVRKGLQVYPTTIQDFQTDQQYDNVIAISSLIHLAKSELPEAIQKISSFLKPQGIFIVSFIEGDEEGYEDPTSTGKLRYFAKWKSEELDSLFSPFFEFIEQENIYNAKMDRTFLLRIYRLKEKD